MAEIPRDTPSNTQLAEQDRTDSPGCRTDTESSDRCERSVFFSGSKEGSCVPGVPLFPCNRLQSRRIFL